MLGDNVYGFVSKRKAIRKGLHDRIMKRDKNLCQYCGDLAQCVDHIVPASFGGREIESNLVASCNWCNQKLSDQHFDNGVEGKRLYISKRLHLKSQWVRKRYSICADCSELFKPRTGGSTELLCAECYEVDSSDINDDLFVTNKRQRKKFLKELNKQMM